MPETKLWITSKEASDMLSARHERPISQAYVRRLAHLKLIKTKWIHDSTSLYHRKDVEQIHIAKRGEKKTEANGNDL